MHPLQRNRAAFAAYWVAWAAIAIGLVVTVKAASGLPWLAALVVMGPLVLVYGFICAAAWYVCQAAPLAGTSPLRVALSTVGSALISASLWLALGSGWVGLVASLPQMSQVSSAWAGQTPMLFAAGVLLFLLSAAVHYVMLAFESSRDAERRALQSQVLATEAELRALRAQLDPHFLFNSLHSISALTSVDPAGARRMCLLLGDFLRQTVALGSRDRITLDAELTLAERYLEIERVRFGDRLGLEWQVEPGCREALVPSLLFQPLVENAVRHGVARRLEGGVIRIAAEHRGERLVVRIANPVDPGPASKGTGVGLANARARLDGLYGRDASFTVRPGEHDFEVEVGLPWQTSEEETTV